MRLCLVWDAEYPWDVRVEKVARSCTAAGHSVTLVARNRRREPPVETLPEAELRRLPPMPWLPARADGALMFPAFFNPRWTRAIVRAAREVRAQAILVRDLPLAPTAVWASRRLGCPVVMDMAENYPAMLAARREARRARPLDAVVRNPSFARGVERWVLPRLDGVMVVVEESRDRLLRAGMIPERVAVVGNTPALGRLDQPAASQDPADRTLRLVYLGLLEVPRGVGTLIDAVARVQADGMPVELTVIGDGIDGALLRAQAERLGVVGGAVTFLGRLPNAEALQLLNGAHAGVVPHWRNESWDTTIPNKLFDYMAAGLAVVSSDAVPAARIVRETGAGLVFRDRSTDDLAAVLQRLREPALRTSMARAGREAIRQRYHWERDEARMLALLERVTGNAFSSWKDGR